MPRSRARHFDTVAGVDLGSNSFHMIVARVDEGQLHLLDRMRERVRLASGLDADRRLTEEAAQRALACLERFGQRVRELPQGAVRAAGTNTLRQAKNSAEFLERAEKALGHPIEVISGREEARLIYLGVAQSVPDEDGRRLVVDIGGGSTECIIGEGFDTLSTESLYMGCVSYSQRFFANGALKKEDFRKAEISALLELQSIERRYRALGWQSSFGSSGTILAVADILRLNGWSTGITKKGLKKLKKEMILAGHVSKLQLPGLDPERASVLPGGVAILGAIVKALRVDVMEPATGALREGLLYDLLGRIRHEDVRDRTIRWLVKRYAVDDEQAMRVERTALAMLEQVASAWGLEGDEHRQYLSWASRLHELGLDVAHTGYHKHSAYIVENADMPGFSRNEQQLLSVIIHAHRRKFLREHLAKLPADKVELAIRLAVVFRLAFALNRSRSTRPTPEFELAAKKNVVKLSFPKEWIEEHPLTRADLEEDALRLRSVGVELFIA
ncbi:exopolyphosphatase [Myxococcota bacterium]|nr:exopolyphosphatase [Myxococcota bacterium]